MDAMGRRPPTTKTLHEIERGSNLDLLLRGTLGALNRFADGLLAIALAISTPNDNSAEVKSLTEKLKASNDQLENAINNQPTV